MIPMGPHFIRPLDPQRIIVLAGGTSAERSVSLESGEAVAHALAGRGHDITLIDPRDADLEKCEWNGHDAVFIALHGTFGEDGQVQQILEAADIPYTGSNSIASRLAISKSASKERFAACDVPTAPYVLIHESDNAAHIQAQAKKLGFPLVVKPDAQGSSLGVSIVQAPDDLPQALARCFHYDRFGILEPAIIGSEWTVGLIDEQVLPVICIETDRGFFDYEAKYEDDNTRHRFDYDVSASTVAAVREAGRNAARAIGTRGVARVDIMVDKYGQPSVLEVNTIPGMTSHSLVPKAAARIGLSFADLCERAIRSCLAAHASSTSVGSRVLH
jgi:D-alanine-D-alanine ligase